MLLLDVSGATASFSHQRLPRNNNSLTALVEYFWARYFIIWMRIDSHTSVYQMGPVQWHLLVRLAFNLTTPSKLWFDITMHSLPNVPSSALEVGIISTCWKNNILSFFFHPVLVLKSLGLFDLIPHQCNGLQCLVLLQWFSYEATLPLVWLCYINKINYYRPVVQTLLPCTMPTSYRFSWSLFSYIWVTLDLFQIRIGKLVWLHIGLLWPSLSLIFLWIGSLCWDFWFLVI